MHIFNNLLLIVFFVLVSLCRLPCFSWFLHEFAGTILDTLIGAGFDNSFLYFFGLVATTLTNF